MEREHGQSVPGPAARPPQLHLLSRLQPQGQHARQRELRRGCLSVGRARRACHAVPARALGPRRRSRLLPRRHPDRELRERWLDPHLGHADRAVPAHARARGQRACDVSAVQPQREVRARVDAGLVRQVVGLRERAVREEDVPGACEHEVQSQRVVWDIWGHEPGAGGEEGVHRQWERGRGDAVVGCAEQGDIAKGGGARGVRAGGGYVGEGRVGGELWAGQARQDLGEGGSGTGGSSRGGERSKIGGQGEGEQVFFEGLE